MHIPSIIIISTLWVNKRPCHIWVKWDPVPFRNSLLLGVFRPFSWLDIKKGGREVAVTDRMVKKRFSENVLSDWDVHPLIMKAISLQMEKFPMLLQDLLLKVAVVGGLCNVFFLNFYTF